MSTTIFISHSTKDDLFADRLAAKLTAAGFAPWLDHVNVKPSSNWLKSVQVAIEESNCGVCVLSNDFVVSNDCDSERVALRKQGKRLYPVRYLKKSGIPWDLESVQYVDLTDDFDGGFEKLVRAIKNDYTIGEADKSGKYSGRFMNFNGEKIAKIRMVFKINIEKFRNVFNLFVRKLCKILGITGDDFTVDSMSAGSTILVINIYKNLGQFLIDLVKSEPELFQEFELERIEFVEGMSEVGERLSDIVNLKQPNPSILGSIVSAVFNGVKSFAEHFTRSNVPAQKMPKSDESIKIDTLYEERYAERENTETKIGLK
jgi:hypothetical protein